MAEEQPRSSISKQVRTLVDIWPVLIFILGLTFATARADTVLEQHDVRIKQFDTLAVDRTDRLARIETKLDIQGKQLDTITKRLEDKGFR